MNYESHCKLPTVAAERVVRGRVVAVTPPTFLVINQAGSLRLHARDSDLPDNGDIIETLVDESVQPPHVLCINRLVVPREDPVLHPDSLFHRMHRDNARIQRLLLLKSQALTLIRSFFSARGFVEWQTPRLVDSPGLEVHLHGFATHYRDDQGRSRPCFLPTSPEFSLKKALCAGMERIFEVCRCFRNGGETGPLHQCEFTMLEWYRAFADYRDIMRDLEELGLYLKEALQSGDSPYFRARKIDWRPPWPRISLQEAFDQHCEIDLERGIVDLDYFRAQSRRLLEGSVAQTEGFDSIFFRLFLTFVEPCLGLEKPEILYDYPISMAALAASKPDKPTFAERFELYVAGVELANAFTELNDPIEQESRFRAAITERKRLGYAEVPIDTQLLKELSFGMPPSAGIALGVERLLMALTGTDHIDDLFFLPHQWDADDDQRLWSLKG